MGSIDAMKHEHASQRGRMWLVSAGRDRRPGSPLNVPLVPASNFVLGEQRAYARDDGTPGWEALEAIVGGLEGGSAVAFAWDGGDRGDLRPAADGFGVALPEDCYRGSGPRTLVNDAADGRSTASQQPTRHAGSTCALRPIWSGLAMNPLLTVGDLDTICAAPRKPGAIVAVDNTFATPLNRPLDFGADLAVQSSTKFIGGHSDLLAGVVAVRDGWVLGALRQSRELTGAPPEPSRRS